MNPLTIHRNLLDAINVLYEPFIPCDTPADLVRNRAARYLKSQLALIEAPILADTSGKCDECESELLNVETHDNYNCPALEDVDMYPPEGYGPGQRYA